MSQLKNYLSESIFEEKHAEMSFESEFYENLITCFLMDLGSPACLHLVFSDEYTSGSDGHK